MQVVVRATLALVVVGACHTTEPARPDAAIMDGRMADGGAVGSAGLTVTWSVQPMVPGDPKTGVSVDELAFLLVDADITGDAGSVKSQAIELHWITGTMPQPIAFPSAPIGLYSKVALDIDGQLVDNSWWINGHATVNGSSLPFNIYDRNSLAVSLDIDAQLSPGKPETIAVEVNLDQAFSQIDFSQIDNDDGTLVLDTDDEYMPTFAANLGSSFTVETSTQ